MCENCGAQNVAGLVICAFCHSTLGKSEALSSSGDAAASLPGLQKLYAEGKVHAALVVINNLYRQNPEVEKDPAFLLLHAKLLIETEGATGHVKMLLTKAFVLAPKSGDIADYQAIIEAKEKLDLGLKEHGETALKALLKRKPTNPHALLILGAHYFWGRTDMAEAVRYLENCVNARPGMLRAWACLGAAYATAGKRDAAKRAFTKCLQLETQPKMVEYFQSMLKQL